ncbi:MAG: hypothetical protein L6R36_004904 [Xanthoria steineri]|nr:MAG: hypothetical protein L6R36_004904 [Xanthoria steineri]
MASNITEAIPQLATVSPCIVRWLLYRVLLIKPALMVSKYPAYQAIAAGGCGLDLKCICTNDMFWATIQGVFATGACSPAEAKSAMENTRTICVAAAPWLGQNRVHEILGAVTTLIFLATVAVVLRFIARGLQAAPYGWDDWLILFALVGDYAFTAVQYLAVHHGFGRHVLMLDASNVIEFGKLFFTDACLFPLGVLPMKCSILWFYHRIYPVRKFTISCIVTAAVTVAWFIASIVVNFLTCRPFQYFWDRSIPGGKCINSNNLAYAITSPPDILTSLALLILPIPLLWGLQMPRRKKLAITDSVTSSGIWLNVELSIGIVSACLPLLRPLFSRVLSSQLRSRFSKSRTGSHRLQDLEASNGNGHSHGKNVSNGGSGGGGGHQRSSAKAHGLAGKGGSGQNHAVGLGDSGIYAGQNRKQPHLNWLYDVKAGATSKGTVNGGRGSEEGSEEDMVPMGKIQVRHDVEWERERQREGMGVGGDGERGGEGGRGEGGGGGGVR